MDKSDNRHRRLLRARRKRPVAAAPPSSVMNSRRLMPIMEFDPSRALPGVDMIAATEPRWRAVCRTLSLPVEDQPALGQALIVLKS